MYSFRTFFLGSLLLLPWGVRGDELPLDVFVAQHASQNKESVSAGNQGSGQSQTREVTFTLRLHNKGIDDISKLSVRLYAIAGENWVDKNDVLKKLAVVKVLSQDGLTVPAMQDKDTEMGDVDFRSTTTSATTPGLITTYYSGVVYAGYALELYVDGQLVDVRVGNGALKKAYQNYLQSHTNTATEAPATTSPEPASGS
jgi:hypothetical protein